MPFQLDTIDNLALAGANIVLDAARYEAHQLVRALRPLRNQGTGSITIRNASSLPENDLILIANMLGGRVTLED
jgi:hypothetical protein